MILKTGKGIAIGLMEIETLWGSLTHTRYLARARPMDPFNMIQVGGGGDHFGARENGDGVVQADGLI